MKIKNLSNKIIGIDKVNVLPGETKEVPPAYAGSAVLEVYRRMGLVELEGNQPAGKKSAEELAAEKEAEEKAAAEAAEALRQSRLASLNGISTESLGALANELGINPADCKEQADVLKKVRAALKK